MRTCLLPLGDSQPDRPNARQHIAAGELLYRHGVRAGLIEKSVVLQRSPKLMPLAAARTDGISLSIKQIKRAHLAEPLTIGVLSGEFQVNILERKIPCIVEVKVKVVARSRVAHLKLKIQRVAVGPLTAGNVLLGLEQIARATSGE